MRRLKKMMCLAALFGAVMLGTSEAKAQENTTILNGLSIGAVDVSGMTTEEAGEAVQSYIEQCRKDEITFHMNGNTYSSEVEPLGYSWSNEDILEEALQYGKDGNIVKRYKQKCDLEAVPVSLTLETEVDKEAVTSLLEEHCTVYNKAVEEYGITTQEDGPTIVGGRAGVSLDVEKSTETVAAYLTKEWAGGAGDIDLDVIITEPKPVKEDLEKITDVLGRASTTYGNSGDNRKTNVKNGTKKIHGTILYPGDTFSMLDACLPFNEANGYLQAGSYASGEVVDSYGGGICQVSSTLYLAVIRAELEVNRRSCHSMLVSYVKPSLDAAIAEGSKDLRFTNNTDAPIYIEGTADGWEVAFTIYGKDTRPEDREVRYVSETLENDDPTIELKTVLWKIVTEDGEETKTEFNKSIYYKKKEEQVEPEDPESLEDSADTSEESEESE